jgi:transposase
MAGRKIPVNDLRELLRQLQHSTNDSAIRRSTGLNRRTIARYRAWATQHDLLDPSRPLPSLEELQQLAATTLAVPAPPQITSSLEPYRELVLQLHAQGVEGTAIRLRLHEQVGYTGSVSAVYRFLKQVSPSSPDVPMRVERNPGTEVQVDFGYAGRLLDPTTGQLRRAWAFVMTLSYSRHLYVEFVFDQSLPTWIALHARAFAFFGGVPQRVVLDNLKAGVTKSCFDDPQIQTTYRECAEHYGFLIAPCAPRTPEHKGKVESGVHFVKRNFLAGRQPTSLPQANADVRTWCLTTAGLRTHGTTKAQPLARFHEHEQAALRPLPSSPYDLAVWKRVKLHRDSYIVFEQSFYSAPCRLVGQFLRVRGGSSTVRIYSDDFALVATHTRAQQAGERHTHPDHLPPEKLPGATWSRETCQVLAAEVGPATVEVVQRLLDDGVVDRHQRVIRILKLRTAVGDARLEAACERALRFDDLSYATLKRMLERGLEQEAPLPLPSAPPAHTFLRNASELLGHLFGRSAWS